MRRVTLNLDKQCYTYKPNDRKEIGAIQNRLATAKTTVTVADLADYINIGATIKAAALNGSKAEGWESQDIFCLNINNKDGINSKKYLSIEAALERCDTYRVKPAFIYETFNSRKDSNGAVKFRIVFVMDRTITDSRVRKAVQLALMKLFPEDDSNGNDLAKMYFGSSGKVMAVDYSNTINAVEVIQAMVNYIQVDQKLNEQKNASTKIKNYCKTVSLNMINNVPNVKFIDNIERLKFEENNDNYIYYIIENASKSLTFEYFDFNIEESEFRKNTISDKKKDCFKKYDINFNRDERKVDRSNSFIDLDKCELSKLFFLEEYLPSHEEFMHICYNILQFEGGESDIISTIEKNFKDSTKEKRLNKIESVKYARKIRYAPSRCSEERCSFYKECTSAGVNILQAIKFKRGSIRRESDKIELASLEGAEVETKLAIRKALRNRSPYLIKVIIAPTGIGKSTMLQTIAKEDNNCFNNVLICVPTHKLATELGEKLEPYVEDLLIIKEPVIKDESVKAELALYQSAGDYRKAREVLDNYLIALSNDCVERNVDIEKQKDSINAYLKALDRAKTTDGCILCTHARMFFLENPNVKRIIIDEDILNTHLQSVTIDMNELLIAMMKAEEYELYNLYDNLLLAYEFFQQVQATPLEVMDFPKDIEIDKLEVNFLLKEYTPKFNIADVLSIEAAVANKDGITAYKKNKLPDLPIIVLSATANKIIYNHIFNDFDEKIVSFDIIKESVLKGKVILHYEKSLSRNYLRDNFSKAVNIIKAEAPAITNMITFKRYIDQFDNAGFNVICNYGACSGIDAFGGKDLIVAGTPHLNTVAYLLLAHACCVKEKINLDMNYIPVNRHGFEFYFNTFNSNVDDELNKLMQEIQFYKIESELIQAVGRARVLRNDCTVHVFGKLPMPNCDLYGEDPIERTIDVMDKLTTITSIVWEAELAKDKRSDLERFIEYNKIQEEDDDFLYS